MKLIVGLGNPGENYDLTRHNVGFMAVDNILSKLKLELNSTNFNGQYVKFKYMQEDWIIAKPLTYMNLSGSFIQKIMHYYKININDLCVISDDLDLSVGTFKFKTTGSSGGHNGLKDIINCLQSEDFKRFKIGIGKDRNMQTSDYVLQKIPKIEKEKIDEVINKITDMLIELMQNKPLSILINKYKTN